MLISPLARHRTAAAIGVRVSGDAKNPDLPGTTGLPLSGTGKVALGAAAILATLGAVYLATS